MAKYEKNMAIHERILYKTGKELTYSAENMG